MGEQMEITAYSRANEYYDPKSRDPPNLTVQKRLEMLTSFRTKCKIQSLKTCDR